MKIFLGVTTLICVVPFVCSVSQEDAASVQENLRNVAGKSSNLVSNFQICMQIIDNIIIIVFFSYTIGTGSDGPYLRHLISKEEAKEALEDIMVEMDKERAEILELEKELEKTSNKEEDGDKEEESDKGEDNDKSNYNPIEIICHCKQFQEKLSDEPFHGDYQVECLLPCQSIPCTFVTNFECAGKSACKSTGSKAMKACAWDCPENALGLPTNWYDQWPYSEEVKPKIMQGIEDLCNGKVG